MLNFDGHWDGDGHGVGACKQTLTVDVYKPQVSMSGGVTIQWLKTTVSLEYYTCRNACNLCNRLYGECVEQCSDVADSGDDTRSVAPW